MTPVVGFLLAANIGIHLLQLMAADGLFQHFALWPLGVYFIPGVGPVGFQPWQLVTSAFLHDTGSFIHIAFNMFALWSFGTMIERVVGSERFAWLYAVSVLSAAVVQLLVVTATVDQGVVPTVGASGGVFGVLLAFAFLFPHRRLIVFPIPIPLKAWVLVAGYAAIELFNGVFGTLQGVAHFAHLGGMLGAAAILFYWWHSASRPRRA